MSLDVPAPVARGFKPPATTGVWTQDAKGAKADPVTLYVHGSLDDVKHALAQGGWTEADPRSLGANVRYLGAAAKHEILQAMTSVANHLDGLEVGLAGVFGFKAPPLFHAKTPYTPGVDRMPVSPQTMGGHPMLTAFERDNDPLGGRHHLRIFDTGERDAQGKEVFAIAASRDSGIRFAPDHPECGFLFHTVEEDVSKERDFVAKTMAQGSPGASQRSFGLPWGGGSTYGEFVGDSKGAELTLPARPPVGSSPIG
jgi:hypothetical protein